ncbi:MAG TPA: hypothetical protein DCS07_16465 [Bdellovibrionales bacterium]|nr:MAG: hypothetical protein A2Z97_15805 [Bdellovibrionales bacterium GWB1_52_6]OFZ06423.1 MAG: hypothetical protein A2X97_03110 [Bdellovibrionales bacterium GWA1_52_35]OFZ40052.1 MAG: hypothetical protein A2070_02450 [Bdellovibrionales bacterium GWC1_52_8]HAR44199.1 hypothetical protein [Bdellovibrionales bacterium]HCM40182.1 hypothetical protein [Bdellovibrionales bacterium]
MIRAAIDLGTNTCLLLVTEWTEGSGIQKVLRDLTTVVRLGQSVDQNRSLHPDAMERTLKCLKHYAETVRAAGGDPAATACVATSQARDARNGAEFFCRVEVETGFRFRVISGAEEARLTFLGALLPGMSAEKSAVIDIGGGSTEIISATDGTSVDAGAVRFTERYFATDPVSDEEFWSCQAAIDEALGPFVEWRKKLPPDVQLVAVAGSATALAAWFLELKSWDPAKVDQVMLSRGDVHRLVEELKWRTVKERSELPCMEPGRADVILAGAMILWRSMEKLNFPTCRISSRGLRYGVLTSAV